MQTNHAGVNENGSKKPAIAEDEVSVIAKSLFDKVREIKKTTPEISRKIDVYEKEIREKLAGIRTEIDKLEKHDKDLVTIFVINGFYRTAEEVLIH